ncbi:MAG: HDOD domain-containing protein [Deltaproteobacteria bacterium]|nr:HDOD domain-containing protein [Deltaproteobacteria bacterium]MBW2034610.1 HDOD domain-containing protein [Deltaproteobacteria bacterium]MBW2115407.1 HDOD domain-containing protein [Deltaproteobacteria bacterium]MBW2358929.1 HDOD domain-containing protein [Deltaproteobacteria bacterium]
MANKYTIDTIKDKIESLPLIDVTVFETISLLNSPDSNFKQVVETLSPDVAARFLNMANSAYYGLEVRSINHAVRLLGYGQMKHILITSILIDHFTKRLKDFSFEKFQKQAQFCAAVSRVLGEILNYGKPEDLFTVAILHNVGKLIIAVYFKEEHKEIIALKKSQHISTSEAEQRILGISHAEIGALVLEKFNIPQDICDAVRFHDEKDRIIPEESNFQLELIARKSASLVSRFALPEDMESSEIVDRLKGTIQKGRDMYREGMRDEMLSKGYKEVFTLLLEQASSLVYRGLKGFQERVSQKRDERSPDISG